MKFNFDYAIEGITTIIKDNLNLFKLNDNKLVKLKQVCLSKDSINDYSTFDNETIMLFVKEALYDLITSNFLYDFRDIE